MISQQRSTRNHTKQPKKEGERYTRRPKKEGERYTRRERKRRGGKGVEKDETWGKLRRRERKKRKSVSKGKGRRGDERKKQGDEGFAKNPPTRKHKGALRAPLLPTETHTFILRGSKEPQFPFKEGYPTTIAIT